MKTKLAIALGATFAISTVVAQNFGYIGNSLSLFLNDWPGGGFTTIYGATGNADQNLCMVLGLTVVTYEYNLVPRLCTHAQGPLTVSTLPAGAVLGDIYTINDAVSCTNGGTLTGGGSTVCLVWFNSAVWHAVAP
jgi:hypothetical protein